MEEILVIVIQFLVELTINILVSMPFELVAMRSDKSHDGPVFWSLVYFIAGVVMGVVSTVVLPTMIPSDLLRILNLFAAPPTAGFLAHALARKRAEANPRIIPREHFWSAFLLTAGFVIIRFAYAERH